MTKRPLPEISHGREDEPVRARGGRVIDATPVFAPDGKSFYFAVGCALYQSPTSHSGVGLAEVSEHAAPISSISWCHSRLQFRSPEGLGEVAVLLTFAADDGQAVARISALEFRAERPRVHPILEVAPIRGGQLRLLSLHASSTGTTWLSVRKKNQAKTAVYSLAIEALLREVHSKHLKLAASREEFWLPDRAVSLSVEDLLQLECCSHCLDVDILLDISCASAKAALLYMNHTCLAKLSRFVAVYDRESQAKCNLRVPTAASGITALALHPSGNLVCLADQVGRFFWVSTATSGQNAANFISDHWHDHQISALAFSPTGEFNYSADEKGIFIVWNIESQSEGVTRDYIHDLDVPIVGKLAVPCPEIPLFDPEVARATNNLAIVCLSSNALAVLDTSLRKVINIIGSVPVECAPPEFHVDQAFKKLRSIQSKTTQALAGEPACCGQIQMTELKLANTNKTISHTADSCHVHFAINLVFQPGIHETYKTVDEGRIHVFQIPSDPAQTSGATDLWTVQSIKYRRISDWSRKNAFDYEQFWRTRQTCIASDLSGAVISESRLVGYDTTRCRLLFLSMNSEKDQLELSACVDQSALVTSLCEIPSKTHLLFAAGDITGNISIWTWRERMREGGEGPEGIFSCVLSHKVLNNVAIAKLSATKTKLVVQTRNLVLIYRLPASFDSASLLSLSASPDLRLVIDNPQSLVQCRFRTPSVEVLQQSYMFGGHLTVLLGRNAIAGFHKSKAVFRISLRGAILTACADKKLRLLVVCEGTFSARERCIVHAYRVKKSGATEVTTRTVEFCVPSASLVTATGFLVMMDSSGRWAALQLEIGGGKNETGEETLRLASDPSVTSDTSVNIASDPSVIIASNPSVISASDPSVISAGNDAKKHDEGARLKRRRNTALQLIKT